MHLPSLLTTKFGFRRYLNDAMKRVFECGNSTKLDPTPDAFNGEQLANDFESMEKMMIALAK